MGVKVNDVGVGVEANDGSGVGVLGKGVGFALAVGVAFFTCSWQQIPLIHEPLAFTRP